AAVARINEQIAKQNADYERAVGEVQAQEVGMKGRFQAGKIVTSQAASGFSVASRSSREVQESQREIIQHDEATVRANAAHRAYGQEVQAMQHEAQARADEYAADYAKTAGYIGAAASILGGASNVSSKWLQYQQTFPA